jgi:antitoxin YefM
MTVTAFFARRNFETLIQKVIEDSAPELITSKKGNAVLMSERDYQGIVETLYLFSTPANARMTLAGIREAETSKGISFTSAKASISYFLKKTRKK